MLNGLIDVDTDKLLPIKGGTDATRSHDMQVHCNVPKSNTRKYFFTNRIVFPWNTLSKDTINSITVNEFKGSYDRERLGKYI